MTTVSSDLLEQIEKEKDPIKQASLINHAYKEEFLSLHQIATHLHKHPSYISHLLRLLKLPEMVLDGYYSKTISLAHLIILSRLDTEADITTAYKEILAHNITSMQLEVLIRELKYHVKPSTHFIPKEILDQIHKSFKEKYPNGKIQIIQSRIKGKLIIEFTGDAGVTTGSITELLDKFIDKEDPEELTVLD